MAEPYRFKRDRDDRSWWKDGFTPANVITIVTIIVAIAIAYAKLQNGAENDHAQIAEMKLTTQAQVDELRKSISTLNDTMTSTNLLVRELSTTVRLEGTRTRLENKQDR
jgi:hypothetical protein